MYGETDGKAAKTPEEQQVGKDKEEMEKNIKALEAVENQEEEEEDDDFGL